MRFFLDTEFIESAVGIELVSIGIVSERGDTFYAESTNFDERNADQWVKDNVLSKLTWWGNENSDKSYHNGSTLRNANNTLKSEFFGPDVFIRDGILRWMSDIAGTRNLDPQFYAYFADYDWVIFCRLFGRMINLPKGFPHFCMDLKQMMEERGLDTEWKRQQCPDPEGEHNALVDAQWNKKLFNVIEAWT